MIESILRSLDDPHARHAMMVHWPIVLTPLAALALAWFAVSKFRSKTALVVAAVLLAGSMAGAGLAAGAGEEAYAEVRQTPPALTEVELEALEAHEHVGEGAWMWPAGCLVLACGAFVTKPRWLPAALGTVALFATLGVTGRFAWTAHLGGVVVYDHGLGVPERVVPEVPAARFVPIEELSEPGESETATEAGPGGG